MRFGVFAGCAAGALLPFPDVPGPGEPAAAFGAVAEPVAVLVDECLGVAVVGAGEGDVVVAVLVQLVDGGERGCPGRGGLHIFRGRVHIRGRFRVDGGRRRYGVEFAGQRDADGPLRFGAVACFAEGRGGGGVVPAVVQERVGAELRVRGFLLELGRGGEDEEPVAVFGVAGGRGDAEALAGPAPVPGAAGGEQLRPPGGAEDVGPVVLFS
jgi:hypothetical protein